MGLGDWKGQAGGGPLDGRVGRSRYAEERRPAASRINLRVHSSTFEEVIVQSFARKRHHDHRSHRIQRHPLEGPLRPAVAVVVNLRRDFHRQDLAHAGRTSVQIVASHDLTLVVRPMRLERHEGPY